MGGFGNLYAKNTTILLSGGLLRKPQIYWVVFWRAQKSAGVNKANYPLGQ